MVAVEVIAGGGGGVGAQAPIIAAETIKWRMVVDFTVNCTKPKRPFGYVNRKIGSHQIVSDEKAVQWR